MTDDVAGAPITGAMISVSPYMPDHQHGTPITVGVTEQGSGMYELTPVNLWMPGYGETTLSVSSAAGKDSAVYKFCLSE